MNQMQNPKNLKSIDLTAQWNSVQPQGREFKKLRHVLRFFMPYFIERGIGPSGVNDAILRKIVETLPVDAAKDYFRRETKNSWAANGFVRAIASIRERHSHLPQLTKIPSVRAPRLAEKEAFKTLFADELEDFFDTYRLPDVFRNEQSLAKVAAAGRALISENNKNGIINGLFNAYMLVTAAGVPCAKLVDLCGVKARPIITRAAKADAKTGRSMEMLRSLSQFAQARAVYPAVKAFNEAARQLTSDHDLNVIDLALVPALQEFSDIRAFHRFGAALVAQAKFNGVDDLRRKITLIRVGSALGALLSVAGPVSFDILYKFFFIGEPDPQRPRQRPTLFSLEYGSLEHRLCDPLRDLLDEFYFGFCSAFPKLKGPLPVMAGKDGKLREDAGPSVNKLLDRITTDAAGGSCAGARAKVKAPFTSKGLRDLGVFRAVWQGDSHEKIAIAAHLSDEAFGIYFKPMLDDIATRKERNS